MSINQATSSKGAKSEATANRSQNPKEFWKWFVVGVVAQIFPWILMLFSSGIWFFVLAYLPFVFIGTLLARIVEPRDPSLFLSLILPVISGSFCYSAWFAFEMQAFTSGRPTTSDKLIKIHLATKDLKINECSDDGFYSRTLDAELCDVYWAIDKISNPTRYAALILEIRRRVELHGKQPPISG